MLRRAWRTSDRREGTILTYSSSSILLCDGNRLPLLRQAKGADLCHTLSTELLTQRPASGVGGKKYA